MVRRNCSADNIHIITSGYLNGYRLPLRKSNFGLASHKFLGVTFIHIVLRLWNLLLFTVVGCGNRGPYLSYFLKNTFFYGKIYI